MKHSGEKPFACDFEGCIYRTNVLSSLKVHKRTHSGEKPFACDVEGCTYSTYQLGNLKSHKVSKHFKVGGEEEIAHSLLHL
jgi:uncharacterized Zn-finger protein